MPDLREALDMLLTSHSGYYNVNRETPAEPFDAEAVFNMRSENYFLIRSAKITQYETAEIIFFISEPLLTEKRLLELCDKAWEEGQSRIRPDGNHRNTDIVLYILTVNADPALSKTIRKIRRYKSFRYGLHGFSHFKLIAYDLKDGQAYTNRMGDDRRKVIDNTFSS